MRLLRYHQHRSSRRSLNPSVAIVIATILSAMLLPGFGCASPTATTTEHAQEPPAISAPGTNPWAGTEYIDKTFEWTYWRFDDIVWTWSVRIPTSLYEERRSRPRPVTGDYTAYAADDGDRAIIADLAATLVSYAEHMDLDAYETIHFIATFVQQLEYTSDLDTTGFDDYGRYPVETLVEGGGDCEDTAILLGKLMDTLGYDVVLVSLPDHMALGVREAEKFVGTYYTFDGVKYFYLETTGLAGRIGIVPDEYKGQSAYIYDFSPRPIVTHSWTGQRTGVTYTMHVRVENHGAAALEDCTVRVGLDAGNDSMWNAVESDAFTLAPGAVTELDLSLALPAYNHTRLLVFIVHDGKALDKSQSRWFDE